MSVLLAIAILFAPMAVLAIFSKSLQNVRSSFNVFIFVASFFFWKLSGSHSDGAQNFEPLNSIERSDLSKASRVNQGSNVGLQTPIVEWLSLLAKCDEIQDVSWPL